jgi:hypothetical protein
MPLAVPRRYRTIPNQWCCHIPRLIRFAVVFGLAACTSDAFV